MSGQFCTPAMFRPCDWRSSIYNVHDLSHGVSNTIEYSIRSLWTLFFYNFLHSQKCKCNLHQNLCSQPFSKKYCQTSGIVNIRGILAIFRRGAALASTSAATWQFKHWLRVTLQSPASCLRGTCNHRLCHQHHHHCHHQDCHIQHGITEIYCQGEDL